MSRADTLLPGILLVAVFVAAALAGCAGDSTPPEGTVTVEATAAHEAPVPPLPDFQSYMVGDLGDPAPGRRDPFDGQRITPAPATTSNPSPRRALVRPRPLRLLGIVQRGGRFVALFDGAMAEEGDAVRGWRVRSIDERSVLVERHGRQRRLSL